MCNCVCVWKFLQLLTGWSQYGSHIVWNFISCLLKERQKSVKTYYSPVVSVGDMPVYVTDMLIRAILYLTAAKYSENRKYLIAVLFSPKIVFLSIISRCTKHLN